MTKSANVADLKSAGSNPLRVQVPSAAPCKDDYFDTNGYRDNRPYFLPKTVENSGFYNTFEKGTVSDQAERWAGDGAFLLFRSYLGLAIVDLLVIVILLGLSLYNK